MAHPIPTPEKKRPSRMTALKQVTQLLSIYCDTPIRDQPITLGKTLSNSVGLRPTVSADQPDIIPPNEAPIGAIAYK